MKKLIKNKSSDWLPDFFSVDAAGIDFAHLKNIGIKACFFDLDHTLLVHGTRDISPRTIKLLKESGVDIYVATNRRFSEDLKHIAKQINAKAVMHAQSARIAKPSRDYYAQAVKLSGYKTSQIAMVGDRLIQDVWGAKRSGLTTVMVAKFGKVKWFDQLFSLHDRLIPVVFSRCYKD